MQTIEQQIKIRENLFHLVLIRSIWPFITNKIIENYKKILNSWGFNNDFESLFQNLKFYDISIKSNDLNSSIIISYIHHHKIENIIHNEMSVSCKNSHLPKRVYENFKNLDFDFYEQKKENLYIENFWKFVLDDESDYINLIKCKKSDNVYTFENASKIILNYIFLNIKNDMDAFILKTSQLMKMREKNNEKLNSSYMI